MTVVPTARAEAAPVASMPATPGWLLCHETAWLAPPVDRTCATKVRLPPTSMVVFPPWMATDATAGPVGGTEEQPIRASRANRATTGAFAGWGGTVRAVIGGDPPPWCEWR